MSGAPGAARLSNPPWLPAQPVAHTRGHNRFPCRKLQQLYAFLPRKLNRQMASLALPGRCRPKVNLEGLTVAQDSQKCG